MENFNEMNLGLLRQPGTVIFGPGQRQHLPNLAARYGKEVLLVTDQRMARTDEFITLLSEMKSKNLNTHVFEQVNPDLPRENIMTVAENFGPSEIDVIVGIGGGSCLDMAKASSVVLSLGGDIREYYGENKVTSPVLPVITVPTTAGTGAEVSCIAVVFDEEQGVKIGVASPYLEPVATVIDPEFTLTLPASLTAATGADALSHLVECFTDISKNPTMDEMENHLYVGKNVLTDVYCRHGLALLNESLETVVSEPQNLDARSNVMLAAFCGGMALNTAGTAAVHALQSPIGGLTGTAHGTGVGVLLPYVMRFNLPARVGVFSELGNILNVQVNEADDLERAKAGIRRIDDMLLALGVPADLAELGVRENDLEMIAEQSLLSTRLLANNPRHVGYGEALEILRRAFAGDRTFWG